MLKSFQILGCSAGIPTIKRGASSSIFSLQNCDIMIDCGEGTYLLWKQSNYKWKNLKYIFITHLHPDHIGGLVPLLFYRKIYSIEEPLIIAGPPELQEYILSCFKFSGLNFNQDITFINIKEVSKFDIEKTIKVKTLEMEHKIPCWGYRIEYENKSIVLITDTLASSQAVKLAKDADILIHEATYEYNQNIKAQNHYHTTNLQAMEIADQSNVGRLILTHFSQTISDEQLNKWIWNGKPCVIYNEKQFIS